MKKTAMILLVTICILSLAACAATGGNGGGTSSAPEVSDSPETHDAAPDTSVDGYFAVPTQYGAIFVPERYFGAISASVKDSDPNTVEFIDAEDGTGLFRILFGKETSIPVTTMNKNGTEVEVFAEFCELDPTADNHDRHLEYQEVLNDIISYFENGPESPDSTDDKNSVFDIETAFMTLKYPAKWRDKVTVDVTDLEVSFRCGEHRLFDVLFGSENGFCVGTLRGMPIYIQTYEFDESSMTEEEFLELCEMQEDMNVLIDRLAEVDEFVPES